jgi:hypothetical protein
MAKRNVTRADLFAHKTEAELKQLGGHSVVAVSRSDGSDKQVVLQKWVDNVVHAMGVFFDCKSFRASRVDRRVRWIFYGIAENTVAAARAFEVAHNLICEWSMASKGVAASNSYCIGASNELWDIATGEKSKEEQTAGKAGAWQTMQQLVKFRETASGIADGWLKDQGVNLNEGDALDMVIQDYNA